MDNYASLLNLNFMASMRTGNLITDMLIAVLIPFISGLVTHFFNNIWPSLILVLVDSVSPTYTEARIDAERITSNCDNVDLDENSILFEAMSRFVATQRKPDYEYGTYVFTRLATSDNYTTLQELLEKAYYISTVPSSECAVDLDRYNNVYFEDNVAKLGGSEGGSGHGKRNRDRQGGRNGGDNDEEEVGKKVVLTSRATNWSATDRQMEVLQEALNHYKKAIELAKDKERYLYQPRLRSSTAGTFGVPPEKSAKDPAEVIMCERYPLSMEKTFNTLFFPQKTRLMRLIRHFQNRTGKFSVPGFPHKLILLLYGPPGTGKTSLVKAIAAYTRRHIFSIPLSRVSTNRELLGLLYDTSVKVPDPSSHSRNDDGQKVDLSAEQLVYVLEDIDAASDIVVRRGQKASPAPPSGAVDTAPSKDGAPLSVPADDTADASATTQSSTTAGGDADSVAPASSPTKSSAANSVRASGKKKTRKGSSVAVDKSQITKTIKGLLEQEDKLTVKGLLEALGGILDAPGRILIMTTNHVEHIDPALVRPGVVTMKLHMGQFEPECAVEMVQHYFRGHPSLTDEALQSLREIVAESLKTGVTGGFSPAEVEQTCAENDTVDDVLRVLSKGSKVEVF